MPWRIEYIFSSVRYCVNTLLYIIIIYYIDFLFILIENFYNKSYLSNKISPLVFFICPLLLILILSHNKSKKFSDTSGKIKNKTWNH